MLRLRSARFASRAGAKSRICRRSSAILVRMRRRSSSIFVSPGPREPMPAPPAPTWPPAWRLIESPQPRRRGSRYSSCASSTCALPSRLLACWLKMSRITVVRSMTLTFTTSSSARRWLGASSVSAITVSAPTRGDDVAQLLRLAAAEVGRGVGVRPALQHAVEHDGAGGLGEGGELAQRVLGVLLLALRVHADEDDVLEAQLPVLDLGDVLELGRQPGDAAQRGALLAVPLLAVRVGAGDRGLVLQRLGRRRRRARPSAPPRARARERTGSTGVDLGVSFGALPGLSYPSWVPSR